MSDCTTADGDADDADELSSVDSAPLAPRGSRSHQGSFKIGHLRPACDADGLNELSSSDDEAPLAPRHHTSVPIESLPRASGFDIEECSVGACTPQEDPAPLCRRAMTILEHQFGIDHRDVVMVRSNLSKLVEAAHELEEAKLTSQRSKAVP